MPCCGVDNDRSHLDRSHGSQKCLPKGEGNWSVISDDQFRKHFRLMIIILYVCVSNWSLFHVLAARRHVNRLCFSAKRPLIESGTAGYLGQVEPLLPFGISDASAPTPSTDDQPPSFQTGCYECQPRSGTQRTYPACTIRNTPSEPIHCVVWAKYLFKWVIHIFGLHFFIPSIKPKILMTGPAKYEFHVLRSLVDIRELRKLY